MRLIRYLNVIIIITTLLSYLSPYVNPSFFWPISILGLAYPILLIINLIFVLFWLLVDKKYSLLSIGCLLLGVNHFTAHIGIKPSSSADSVIKIMSYNTHHFAELRATEANQEQVSKSLNNWWASHSTDIALLQETGFNILKKNRLLTHYAHHHIPKSKKLAILSNFPIVDKGIIDFGNSFNSTIWADLDIGNHIIRVYSVHLRSNRLNREAIKTVRTGKVSKRSTWAAARDLIFQYKDKGYQRIQEVKEIIAHLEQSPYPVLIGGDFNEPPTSYIYRRFDKYLVDGFRQKGVGLGATYAGDIPFLRIDYIFATPDFKFLSYRKDKIDFSDHYPLIARLNYSP